MQKYSQSWKQLQHLANHDDDALKLKIEQTNNKLQRSADRAIASLKELGLLLDDLFGLNPKK